MSELAAGHRGSVLAVLLALTGYEIALAIVAFAFIVFALVAALVIPRSRPEFPGSRLGLFIAICGVFFIAQLTAVLVLAEVGEADEPVEEGVAPPPTEEEQAGDAVAGREVFLGASGCASCHTLSDAGASGAIGPNLDATQPPSDLVVERVTNGLGGMPSFSDSLTEEQIQDVAAYVSSTAGA